MQRGRPLPAVRLQAVIDRRTIFKHYLKLVNHEGSPDYTARGVAIGLFACFFAPTFTQVITALALAYLFRGNKILAVALTFITNPYTSPVLCPFQCWVGSVALGAPITYAEIAHTFQSILSAHTMADLLIIGKELGKEYLIPFIVGGALLGVVSGVIGYFVTLWLVAIYRRRRKLRRDSPAAAKAKLPPVAKSIMSDPG